MWCQTVEYWGEACTLTLALTSSLQTLKSLRQVEVINFGDCLVRSKGAVAIADAVRGGLPKLKVPAPPPAVFPWGLGFPRTQGLLPWVVGGRAGRGSGLQRQVGLGS